jgi:hypothetical protein
LQVVLVVVPSQVNQLVLPADTHSQLVGSVDLVASLRLRRTTVATFAWQPSRQFRRLMRLRGFYRR